MNRDLELHVRGQSRYIDDVAPPAGLLHAAVVASPAACGRLVRVDAGGIEGMTGVVGMLTSADIPGENQIGSILPDEVLLADREVDYVGQPVALIVARDADTARRAAVRVRVEIEEQEPVLHPREAYRRGRLIGVERTFVLGDVDAAWSHCDLVVRGRVDSGGQEHVYLETQGAVCEKREGGTMRVISATQSPTSVQRAVARVLGLSMSAIEVDVGRLGGAFGGKEDQATAWAALAALAAWRYGSAAKLVLRRHEDMRMTGKRHPYASDYALGLRRDGTLVAYEAMFYQNAGAAADLSTSILERTLFHCTNSYRVPHVRARAACCRTNLPPNTAFRGFGAPQGAFVIEAAMSRAAHALGMAPWELRRRNLLCVGDELPYGMAFENRNLDACWDEVGERFGLEAAAERVARFNSGTATRKKGLSVMPVAFGISFTTTFLNQASALVHVYTDGSVSLSVASVEMGQGVNMKLRQVSAGAFGISEDRVRVESTNTLRVANTPPTAASTCADLNGNAVLLACRCIRQRLLRHAAGALGLPESSLCIEAGRLRSGGVDAGWDWDRLVREAYQSRVSLSAQAHYATPHLHFDKAVEKGRPFAYHAVGAALTEVTVDVLRGTYAVDAVRVVHDIGRTVNAQIDTGQIEGAVLQGIGWMTIEELLYSEKGRLLTDTLATYKAPDLYTMPGQVQVVLHPDEASRDGLLGAKAVGEPPFLYGIGAYLALWEALCAACPALGDGEMPSAPLTPEKVFMTLHGEGGRRDANGMG